MTPRRVSEEDELGGLDLALHGEAAYNLLPSGALNLGGGPHGSHSEGSAGDQT